MYDLEIKEFFFSPEVKFVEEVFSVARSEDVNIIPLMHDINNNIHHNFAAYDNNVIDVDDMACEIEKHTMRDP